MSTLEYYELLLSGRRATRHSIKETQSTSSNNTQKTPGSKPSKKKSKPDKSSPHKKKKIDELVPPSPPEEKVKIKYLYGCVWGEDAVGRKVFIETDDLLKAAVIQEFEPVEGELMPVRYLVDDLWVDLRNVKLYLTGEIVDFQGKECEVLWNFPFPISYPRVLLRTLDMRLVNADKSELIYARFPAEIKQWVKANSDLEVKDSDICKLYFRFLSVKNSNSKVMVLRKHQKTGKYFIYKDKQFRWVNPDKLSLVCNRTEPPLPLSILSTYTPGQDLRKIYKTYMHVCEISFPSLSKDLKDFCKRVRCKICDYILDVLDYKQCENCQSCYHCQCLEPVACKNSLRDVWRCPDCPRCENCLGSSDKLLKCVDCNNSFHERCVDPNFLPTPCKMWRCELCAQCVHCKIRATDENVKWNENITKCTSCDSKWKKNEYCSICEKFWFSKKGRQSRTEQRLSQINDDPEMIECDKCKMWVHLICDTKMTNDLWALFTADKTKKYFCPRCLKENQNMEIVNLVTSLMELEKNNFFYSKIEDGHYKKVIKNPMCFEAMIENAKEGVYHNQLPLVREHFILLCENAMNYLKANSDGYKAAKKLLEDGIALLDGKLLPSKRKKNSTGSGTKKVKIECDLEGFNMDLPTSLDKPEYYEFSMDLLSTLPKDPFLQPLNIIINKSDIQPFMGPKPMPSFYLSLLPISYSDPLLCLLEQCYICASFIQSLDYLVCYTCGRAFHTYCISSLPVNIMLWQCKDCKVCEICHSTQYALSLLFCKKCEKGFDIPCLWPNIKSGLYLKDWICDNCFDCERCHSKTYHPPSFSPSREDFFSDFSLCYNCKWVVINKEYCQECGKDWASPYEPDQIISNKVLCKSCESFFHSECVNDSKGICNKCNNNSAIYADIEQVAIEKVNSLMSIMTQASLYQLLAKHCIQNRYELDNDLAHLLANFFLVDNQEFLTHNKDIKEFFAMRGVEIAKKSSKRKAGYKNSRIPKIDGLSVSDLPSCISPLVRVHRPKDPLPIWSVEWDTSALVLSLDKFLSPLDSIELVELPFVPSSSQSIVSFIPCFVFDFDMVTEFMEIKKDPELSQSGRCDWLRNTTKEISPIVDETLYEDKSDLFKLVDAFSDVLVKEYTHEQVISQYVHSELPAVLAFINQFELWLGKRMVELTQHILNTQVVPLPIENSSFVLLQICGNNSNVENDLTCSLQCTLCKEFGEKTVSGRLLPCEDNLWVHVNCAFWSSESKVDDSGNLPNFHMSVSKAKRTKCKECGKFGASLSCSARKCRDSYHFPCALQSSVVFLNTRCILCSTCVQSKELSGVLSPNSLLKPLTEKVVILKNKKYLKKPSFVMGNFNRIGSLILTDISDKFCSYRLFWVNNIRKLVKCCKIDNQFVVYECCNLTTQSLLQYEDRAKEMRSVLESGSILHRSNELEDLWPKLKAGESFALKSAADFFGLSSSAHFSIVLGSSSLSGTAKESKSILEKIANIKPSQYGSSKFQPFLKHKIQNKTKKIHKNQKSAGYEEHHEGKSETILASEYRKYKRIPDRESTLEVSLSNIHGLGLYTMKDIQAGRIVVEYIGEIVRNKISDLREKEYELKGIGQGSCYMFRLDEDHVIDATVKGGKARFINHSCQPNCAASVCEIDGEKHILLFAKRFIHKNEEITYDYNFEVEEDKISCQCGSKDCQGKLN